MKILLLILPLISNISFAWETDNFSTRVALKKQSADISQENLYRLNNHTNKELEAALAHFNNEINEKRNCNRDSKARIPQLFSIIKNTLGGGFISGALEKWSINKKSKIQYPKLETDIYSALLWNPDPSINFGGIIIGSDKLGHFIDQGYSLFTEYKMSGEITDALKFSEYLEEEEGPYGLRASGVKSYGDLAANYSGFMFYQNLLGGPNPHLSCNEETGKYELVNPVNFADYLNNAMDEGINCSLFYSLPGPVSKYIEEEYKKTNFSPKLKSRWIRRHKTRIFRPAKKGKYDVNQAGKTMYKNLKKLYNEEYSKPENRDLKLNNFCPVENNKCETLVKEPCASYYISPQCYLSVTDSKDYTCTDPEIKRVVLNHQYQDYTYPNNYFTAATGDNKYETGAKQE